jgi:hypothetical protein
LADSLSEKLLALPAVQRELRYVTIRSVASQFECLKRQEEELPAPSLNYLLECASVLAHSQRGPCQDAALRVAQYCLSTASSSDQQRLAAAVILNSMTNIPAVALAIERVFLKGDYESELPTLLKLDSIRRAIRYAKATPDGASLEHLNAFQASVYEGVDASDWVSISAPTSSGKSHVLLRILEELIVENRARNIVFLVPTRALIQQLEFDIRALFARHSDFRLNISSIPRLSSSWTSTPNVFVFTQERLHWLLTDAPDNFTLDALFVDEAQKVGDGARGVLLEDVLLTTATRFSAQHIFSSPMASNPDILLHHAPASVRTLPIASEQVTVNQNLIWINQLPRKPTKWIAHLCFDDSLVALGELDLPNSPTSVTKRLPMVAHALAHAKGGNLLYANGAAAAERAAQLLWDLEGPRADTDDAELQELATLTKTIVHPSYLLATVLMRGIAFHYGNMPLLLRSEIERLFKAGKIHFLVCTPTLIEGVNLPARTIFLRGPQKGIGHPLSEIDFWNLAGRAGRQGMEFQGNVVCVDASDEKVWPSPPPKHRGRYAIKRQLDEIAGARSTELFKYIEDGTPRGSGHELQELEYSFVFFLQQHIAHGSFHHSPLAGRYPASFVQRIETLCAGVAAQIAIPLETIRRNPGVSPLAMQKLYEYFLRRPDLPDLIPVVANSNDAYEHYKHVIGIIATHLTGDPQSLNPARAVLVVNWMRGYSLSRMIENSWRYWEPKGKTLSFVIRQTMKDVEEFLRFGFAKSCACYLDVLRLAMAAAVGERNVPPMPDLRLALEFGASARTQISLMGLGLSRSSAIAVSEFLADDDLDETQAKAAILTLNLEGLGVSRIIIAEIRKVTS